MFQCNITRTYVVMRRQLELEANKLLEMSDSEGGRTEQVTHVTRLETKTNNTRFTGSSIIHLFTY